MELFAFLAWIVRWIDIVDLPRPLAMKLNYGLFRCARELFHVGRKKTESSGRHSRASRLVELFSHAEIELARYDRDVFYLQVRVGRNLVTSRHREPHRIWSRIEWISLQHSELCPGGKRIGRIH